MTAKELTGPMWALLQDADTPIRPELYHPARRALEEIEQALAAARTPPGLEATVKTLWLKIKPGKAAQSVRAGIAHTIEGDAELPDYVWDLVDIAAAIARAEGFAAAREMAACVAQRLIDEEVDESSYACDIPDLIRALAERRKI